MSTQYTALLREVPRHRKLPFPRIVTPATAREFNSRLKKLCRSPKPVVVVFDARGNDYRGGDTNASLAIYDTIGVCGSERVYGLVSKAYSGGLIALQACGIRIGRPNSKYLAHSNYRPLHEVILRADDDTDEWLEKVREHAETVKLVLRRVGERAQRILLDRALAAGRTEEEFSLLLKENRVMGADEALKWGFIDVVRRR